MHRLPRQGEIWVPHCASFLFKNKMPLSHRHEMLMSWASAHWEPPMGQLCHGELWRVPSRMSEFKQRDVWPYCDQTTLCMNGDAHTQACDHTKRSRSTIPRLDNSAIFTIQHGRRLVLLSWHCGSHGESRKVKCEICILHGMWYLKIHHNGKWLMNTVDSGELVLSWYLVCQSN